MNNFSGSPHQDDKTEVEKMMETVMACLEDTRSIAELTSLLNYANTPLEEFRVNAWTPPFPIIQSSSFFHPHVLIPLFLKPTYK